MALAAFVVMHGGPAGEVTFLEYLYRVLISLVGLGGIALLCFWGVRAIEAVGSSSPGDRRRGDGGR